jgi:hypothetical protein
MEITLAGQVKVDRVEFAVDADDGDLNIKANGVAIGHVDGTDGKLYLYHIDEEDRALLGSLSLSNGRLTVAVAGN